MASSPSENPMILRPALTCLTVVALTLSIAGCKSAPRQRPVQGGPVDTGPQTLTAARKYLHGNWALESFEVYPPGKPPITLKGSGNLSYDDFGNLRIEIRADQSSSDLLRAAGIDIRDGVISSDGRTAVDMQNRTLTYIVQGQTGSGPLSLSRPRYWEVNGNMLTLTTKDESGKPLSVGRWRKTG
jgi:hypothetical protein